MSEDWDKPKTTMYLVTDGAGLGRPVVVNTEDLDIPQSLISGKSVWVRHVEASRGFAVPISCIKPTALEAMTAQLRKFKDTQDYLASESQRYGLRAAAVLDMIDQEAKK